MSTNKLILSIFVPASSDSDNATIIRVESVPDKGLPVTTQGYVVIVTEGRETHAEAFRLQFDAVERATSYAALIAS